MKTFVLIHGACHGGWAWDKLKPKLEQAGYEVFAPTLPGCESPQTLIKEITLQDHVDAVINLIREKNLSNIILVGHSYAGLVITAVNEIIPERIAKLVFLDAYIPTNGKTGMEILTAQDQQSWQRMADQVGEGWQHPRDDKSIDLWGVTDPKVREWLLPRIVSFSLNFMKTPIFLSEHFVKVPKIYIRCTKPSYCYDLMEPFYQEAQKAGWPIYKINSDHEPMLTATNELAQILLELAIL